MHGIKHRDTSIKHQTEYYIKTNWRSCDDSSKSANPAQHNMSDAKLWILHQIACMLKQDATQIHAQTCPILSKHFAFSKQEQ